MNNVNFLGHRLRKTIGTRRGNECHLDIIILFELGDVLLQGVRIGAAEGSDHELFCLGLRGQGRGQRNGHGCQKLSHRVPLAGRLLLPRNVLNYYYKFNMKIFIHSQATRTP
ncbi:hypothetical protein CHELA40_10632 [Chelatococcus asaccharovorans]|nr:hypothetical protein CHELA40_10632 [Chelatococcus asaccharovorans]CAH1686377.1 hypothetical protein CHELA17_64976 [Chelatococcus asaccharovorans]